MSVSRRPVPGDRAGFTLVELVVIIGLIGLLAAIALPRIDTGRIQTRAAIQGLGNTLLAAQREALARQHNVLILIDTAARQLRVHYDSTNDLTVNNNERVRAVELGRLINFARPNGVTPRGFGSNAVNTTTVEPTTRLPAIVFYRNGSAREYGGLYITPTRMQAGNAGTWAVEVTRASGRPEWYAWTGTRWKRGF